LGAPQTVASSPLLNLLDVPAEFRRLDNFEDYEIILHRTEEVGEFLSQNSGSACCSRRNYGPIVLKSIFFAQHVTTLPPTGICLLQPYSGITPWLSQHPSFIGSSKIQWLELECERSTPLREFHLMHGIS
jgi:hypothetical protein